MSAKPTRDEAEINPAKILSKKIGIGLEDDNAFSLQLPHLSYTLRTHLNSDVKVDQLCSVLNEALEREAVSNNKECFFSAMRTCVRTSPLEFGIRFEQTDFRHKRRFKPFYRTTLSEALNNITLTRTAAELFGRERGSPLPQLDADRLVAQVKSTLENNIPEKMDVHLNDHGFLVINGPTDITQLCRVLNLHRSRIGPSEKGIFYIDARVLYEKMNQSPTSDNYYGR